MRRDLRLVEPLRWRDVKDRECGCEQFGTEHTRDVDRFDGSHNDDADEKERERESERFARSLSSSPYIYPSGSCQFSCGI